MARNLQPAVRLFATQRYLAEAPYCEWPITGRHFRKPYFCFRQIRDVPQYIACCTRSGQVYLRTSTEFLPFEFLSQLRDCFVSCFRLSRGLSAIVGAEEIQGRSSGVAVIRPVNLLQTSTSIQRKNKPSARWEATSEFDPFRSLAFPVSCHSKWQEWTCAISATTSSPGRECERSAAFMASV
jgi:hypothetical protein